MLSTRGISSLAFVEKLGDYSFKLEFKRGGEEKSVGVAQGDIRVIPLSPLIMMDDPGRQSSH
jgi:hypothetical protein